jgi:NAD(P)-dependent dehydrogenase (short-subunit alcohol dehydrogenase family)
MDASMIFDLSEEVAVVIGATGVLGGSMAEGLAQAGAKVAVLGRNAGRGEACVKRIREAKAKQVSSPPMRFRARVCAERESKSRPPLGRLPCWSTRPVARIRKLS